MNLDRVPTLRADILEEPLGSLHAKGNNVHVDPATPIVAPSSKKTYG